MQVEPHLCPRCIAYRYTSATKPCEGRLFTTASSCAGLRGNVRHWPKRHERAVHSREPAKPNDLGNVSDWGISTMDQPVYLRRLLRQKVLLIIGAVVAIIAGLLA